MKRRTHLLKTEYERRCRERGEGYRAAMEAIKAGENEVTVWFWLDEFRDLHAPKQPNSPPVYVAVPHQYTPTKPGDLLALCIKKITGATPSANCSCNARMGLMNDWGWWGCWKQRHSITFWLSEEARKRGHAISEHELMSLFKAAFKEVFSRKKATE